MLFDNSTSVTVKIAYRKKLILRVIFTDDYSYRDFFYKREHLVFFWLKIPVVDLF